MVDDRSKRRAQTHGRDRRREDPRGLPQYIEPELTPAPQEPPRPDSLEGYDTIAPPVQRQLDAQAVTLSEMAGWLKKLEPLRDENRLDRIESNLGAIAAASNRHQSMLDDMLVPQLDRWRAMTDELHGQVPKLIASIEQMTILVGNLEQRVRAVEITISKMVDRIENDGQSYEKWFAASEKDRDHIRSRVAVLEQVHRDQTVAQEAIAKVERQKSRKAGVLAGGGAAGLVAIAERIYHHFF